MKYANRLKNLTDDTFVKAMDITSGPSLISFAAGSPDSNTYPLEEIENSIDRVITTNGKKAFGYCATRGEESLREIIRDRMKKVHSLDYSLDEIIITNGSQQGLDMSGMLFIDRGDVVLFESPSYLGALNALRAYEANLVAISTNEDGMDLNALEAAIEKYGDKIKMIYVNPDYQNPTGRCWSEKRRSDFMNIVSEYDLPILEDGAYGELSFSEEKNKPLAAYDKNGQVIYIGTFSKTFCPGFRVAWLCAKEELMKKYMVLKNSTDLSSSAMFQLAIVDYMERNDYAEHLKKIGELYKERCQTMADAIDKYFPKEVSYTMPKGGLFIWLELPEYMDAFDILQKGKKAGVVFVPGISFFADEGRKNHMRLNFSNVTPTRIKIGIKKLGEIVTEAVKPC